MKKPLLSLSLLTLLFLTPIVSAHYLFLGVSWNKDKSAKLINLYFEEGPRPGDGHYLDPFIERGKTWIRTLKNPKPEYIKMSEVKEPGKRWLSGTLPAKAPYSIESFCTFGTYRYGKIDVLLHYNSKIVQTYKPSQLETLARAEKLTADIVPTITDDGVELQVLYQGKPAAGRTILIRGVAGKNLKTDDKGKAKFKPTKPGRYLIRTYVELNEAGEYMGKKYSKIRHHSTLSIILSNK